MYDTPIQSRDSGRRPSGTFHHLTTREAVTSGTVSSTEPPRTPQLGPREHTWHGSIVLNTIDFEFKRSGFRVEVRVGVGPIEVEIGDGDGLGVSVRVYGLRFKVHGLFADFDLESVHKPSS